MDFLALIPAVFAVVKGGKTTTPEPIAPTPIIPKHEPEVLRPRPTPAQLPQKGTAARILIDAKGLIDQPEKWVKGRLWNQGATAFCAAGAISYAATGSKSFLAGGFPKNTAFKILREALPGNASARDTPSGVPLYNNDPCTTHADMMAWFDRAIDAAMKAER